jgi:hypothetical protein
LLNQLLSFETRNRDVNTPRFKIVREIAKKILVYALDKNVDLAGATETASRIKRDNERLARM